MRRRSCTISQKCLVSHTTDLFRMLFSGAWNSRPNPNYYEKLVEEKLNVKGPYTEEIEKDVRR